jgi:hypothetical protein
MVGINYLETPVSFALLPGTLTVKFGPNRSVCLLTHFVGTSV